MQLYFCTHVPTSNLAMSTYPPQCTRNLSFKPFSFDLPEFETPRDATLFLQIRPYFQIGLRRARGNPSKSLVQSGVTVQMQSGAKDRFPVALGIHAVQARGALSTT